jgi:hypothetical protein
MSLFDNEPSRRSARALVALALSTGLLAGSGVAASAAVAPMTHQHVSVVTSGDHDRCDRYKAKAEEFDKKADRAHDKAKYWLHKAKEAERDHEYRKAREYRAKAREAKAEARDYEEKAAEYWKKYRQCKHH